MGYSAKWTKTHNENKESSQSHVYVRKCLLILLIYSICTIFHFLLFLYDYHCMHLKSKHFLALTLVKCIVFVMPMKHTKLINQVQSYNKSSTTNQYKAYRHRHTHTNIHSRTSYLMWFVGQNAFEVDKGDKPTPVTGNFIWGVLKRGASI